MPKREDERLRNMSGKHPAACTCVDCTERFLRKNRVLPRYGGRGILGFMKRIFGKR